MCDVAPRAQRTKKIGRLLSMNYFGFFVGSMTAGGLLEFHGFYVIFGAVLVLHCASALVAVRLLKTREQVEAERLEAEMASSSTATEGTIMPFQTIGDGASGKPSNQWNQPGAETDGIAEVGEVKRRCPTDVSYDLKEFRPNSICLSYTTKK